MDKRGEKEESGELIHLDQIRLEQLLKNASKNTTQSIFKINAETCTITEVIKYNRPLIPMNAFKNATPEKLIPNRNAANHCRTVIKSVHTTGHPQSITLPIILPNPKKEIIYKCIHFSKSPNGNTVFAIGTQDYDFL
jgi:hypothetical protein